MIVAEASYDILTPISEGGIEELQRIELVGRKCYKSEDKITEDGESAKRFVGMLIKNGHEAMIEHSQLSVLFVCDRGFSHELVRHRIASFAQESTRYCNYSKDKFGNQITVIKPYFLKDRYALNEDDWYTACKKAEEIYFAMLRHGCSPEEARAVLPMSLKTEVVITTNYREWRNILKLRTDKSAHPQMRELMIPLLNELKRSIPVVFDDIEPAPVD